MLFPPSRGSIAALSHTSLTRLRRGSAQATLPASHLLVSSYRSSSVSFLFPSVSRLFFLPVRKYDLQHPAYLIGDWSSSRFDWIFPPGVPFLTFFSFFTSSLGDLLVVFHPRGLRFHVPRPIPPHLVTTGCPLGQSLARAKASPPSQFCCPSFPP